MRKTIFTTVIFALMTTTLFGMWAVIPVEELVAESDLIVVGTLYSPTEDHIGIGKGYIHVEEIIFGNARTRSSRPLQVGDSLKIEWADNWACASGMHMGRVGKRGVWLLQVKPGGTVDAGYPGRFTTDEKESTLIRKLVKTKKKAPSVEIDVKPSAVLSPQTESVKNIPINVALHEEDLPAALARASITFFLAFGLFILLYRKRFGV